MKKKDIKDLNTKTRAELLKMAGDLKKQIEKASLDLKARRTKNTNVVKNMKKDLARVLTICNISKEK